MRDIDLILMIGVCWFFSCPVTPKAHHNIYALKPCDIKSNIKLK